MNEKPNAITVCVEYDDLLAITLPHTMRHVNRLLVVTSTTDAKTAELCKANNVECLKTDVFYDRGADFNKGAAIEQGFDVLGRTGWILILDADIVLPIDLDLSQVSRGFMWGCQRWIVPNPNDWEKRQLEPKGDIYGYFQLFHAADAPQRPWYPTNYRSAATVDQCFGWTHFPNKGKFLDQTVLHLGEPGPNWCGRTQPRLTGEVPCDAQSRRASLNDMVRRRLARDKHAELLK